MNHAATRLLQRRWRWLRHHWLLSLVPALEAQFQAERRHTYVTSIVVAVATAFALLGVYLAVDLFAARQFWRAAFLLPVLGMAALPAGVAVVAILRRPTPRRFPIWWVALPAASNALCWAVLPSVGDLVGAPWPYEIMLFNFLYTFFFLAVPARLSALIALATALTFATLRWFTAAHDWPLFSQVFIVFGFVLHGAVAGAILERNERHHWLSRRRLAEQARRDGLTGLFNRRRFFEQADITLRQARRKGAAVTLLVIDADHFKRFNDTHGHGAGDVCLQRLAGLLAQRAQRPLDCAARIGGEEFALLYFDAPELWALARAEELCAAARRLHTADHPCTTLSIGLATGDGGLGITTLLQRADAALYRAKAAGRDRVST